MKHINLIRIDDKTEIINISLGEAVIGRGPLLQCTDKRVSRKHAVMNLSEVGDIVLTSKHTNPIYYSKKDLPLQQIDSEQSVTLNDGDEFALLPDCYRFRVAVLSDNVQNGCNNGDVGIDKDTVIEDVQKAECLKIEQAEELNSALNDEDQKMDCSEKNEDVDSADESLSVANSVRTLPDWMTGTSTGSSAPAKKERKRKGCSTNATVSKKTKVSSDNRKKKTDECGEKSNDEDETDVDNSTSRKKAKQHELSDDDDDEKEEPDDGVAKGQSSTSSKDKVLDDEEDQTGNAADNIARQKCQYGATCFRKNPQHRRDFTHPGDADYDDGNLPECPYGLLCYRKNKQHRLDYKHTYMPLQQNTPNNKKRKNAATRKNYAEDDDDEDDDYDYDDPFLNDASSDDYQPTDSDSDNSATSAGEDEEDTNRMLKEAKRFTKRKK